MCHHNPILIRNRSWKDRLFWKNLHENKKMVLNKCVKNIQTTGFNGVRTVYNFWHPWNMQKPPSKVPLKVSIFKNYFPWPKISPNLNFCSMKITHCVTYICIMTLLRRLLSSQEFRWEGWTETAIILCKLNKSL